MIKKSALKVGSVLSETSFFVVTNVTPQGIVVKDDNGASLNISTEYVENILQSGEQFITEEKKTMTELADILLANPRVAMTVCFRKADVTKGKKVFEAEKAAKILAIQNAKVSEVEGLLSDMIENPLSRIIPGEMRIMVGRHEAKRDDLGRLTMIDMQQEKGTAVHDARVRLVDPRSVSYIIVGNVKYSLK